MARRGTKKSRGTKKARRPFWKKFFGGSDEQKDHEQDDDMMGGGDEQHEDTQEFKQDGGRRKKSGSKSRKTRKLSGYMKFVKAMRPKVVSENPNMKFASIGRELGARWRKMSTAEKAKY